MHFPWCSLTTEENILLCVHQLVSNSCSLLLGAEPVEYSGLLKLFACCFEKCEFVKNAQRDRHSKLAGDKNETMNRERKSFAVSVKILSLLLVR